MNKGAQIRVGVVGARGLAGQELCSLLLAHPGIELSHCWSAREGITDPTNPTEGAPAIETWRGGADFHGALDAVLLATPHGKSAPLAADALDQGALVIDLSGDLRIPNLQLWEKTYGQEHPCPGLLDGAVYGLTEWSRDEIKQARLIANPGCYPTSVLLAIKPLLGAGLLDETAPVISDSKSGVSGAGAAANATTHYGSVHENFCAYGVGTHRHSPEIEVHLGGPEVIFVPHLLPCYRGILSSIYVQPAPDATAEAMHAALEQRYCQEPFVRVLPLGSQPSLRDVQNSNRCLLAVAQVGSKVVVTSAIDNLVKGAAGQAIQNLNLALGLDETMGLV